MPTAWTTRRTGPGSAPSFTAAATAVAPESVTTAANPPAAMRWRQRRAWVMGIGAASTVASSSSWVVVAVVVLSSVAGPLSGTRRP